MASNGDRTARTMKPSSSVGNNSPVGRGGRRRQNRKHPYRPSDKATVASTSDASSKQASQAQAVPIQPAKVDAAPAPLASPADTTGLTRFDDLAKYNIHPTLLKTIAEDLKFEYMTPVQAATLPLLLSGRDVLAQAKTGTGKTVAFLLPVIQKLVANKNNVRLPCLLVISPTRELAMQIAEEAKQLLQRFPKYKVCTAIGGTNMRSETSRIRAGCDILVATPGRLQDHLTQEDGSIRAMMQSLQSLVLDECDRLLDMGFLRDLKKIIGLLADQKTSQRQGMLFSATIAPHVSQFASLVLSDGYQFISTIPKGEAQTHDRVPQHVTIVPEFSDVAAGAVGAIRQEMARVGKGNFKAIVFAPTAALVDFYADVLGTFRDLPPICSLHSRMTQSKRSRVTEDFRNASNGILCATDVVARGIDFPAISNVFQVGLPMDRESYIHRLGRTARAGADGHGTLVLTSHEAFFPRSVLKGLKLDETPADLSARADVSAFTKRMEPDKQTKVYQAWLGYYKDARNKMNWSVNELVQQANDFAFQGLGAPGVPVLQKKVVGKMGLKGVRGLNVV
ncbi:tp-dependent rna helicase [Diaporthe amygdali]|uniref:tp-dependent rna helicase n=1 Tax=Phomopsis amygdali TaxID=1214568 RepID=UPI0022FF0E0A|nr:tp-dependent rna helicase [Diaporthe amygdali]KAJ0118785.1 tp-dependent rna helicase [Diaporthe amygdali]